MTGGYYFHAPSQLSRMGVVDVGLKCAHRCSFCYYRNLGDLPDFEGMRHAKFHSREHLLTLITSLAQSGLIGFDVTGGEPTLHPNIVEAIRHASGLGLSSRIITLGQYLMRPMKSAPGYERLIDGLLDAGLTDFLFSYHAADPEIFRAATGEDLAKLTAAMDYLDVRGFHYTTNTTVFEGNFRHLPDLARSLVGRNTYLHNFIIMNAYYNWGGQAEGVQAHYGAVAPYLREAVAILEDAAIAVNVRYAPLCTMAGLEKNIVGIAGVRYDPHEWMNAIDHSEATGDPVAMGQRIAMAQGDASPGAALVAVKGGANGHTVFAGRGDEASGTVNKVFPDNCRKCSAIGSCDGVDGNYLARRGPAELVPYVAGRSLGEPLHEERLTYRPAFFVKRKPEADMKAVMRRVMQPQPVAAAPKISAIVPCFNYGQYLAQCLDSLTAQTWRDLEIIVVDDGSTDDTAAVAARYPSVRYIRQENSGQPAYPRNAGIALSSGELIFCLDADDWVAPSYVEECVRQFQAHPEASIVWTGTQAFGTASDMFAAAPYDFAALLHECRIVCAAMFRREVWTETGGYKTNIRGSEDWNLWVEAGGLGHIGVPIPRQLFNYRRHADGLFETEVVPNFAAKVRQVVLNNSDLYPADIVAQARAGGKIERAA